MSKPACFLTHPFRDSVVPFEFSKKKAGARTRKKAKERKRKSRHNYEDWGNRLESVSCAKRRAVRTRAIRNHGVYAYLQRGLKGLREIRERERERGRESWARSRRDNCVIPPIWRNLFVRSLERTFRVYVDGTYIYTYNSCGSHHLLRKAAT